MARFSSSLIRQDWSDKWSFRRAAKYQESGLSSDRAVRYFHLVFVLLAPLLVGAAEAQMPHLPIIIVGGEGFLASTSGVGSGSGTAADQASETWALDCNAVLEADEFRIDGNLNLETDDACPEPIVTLMARSIFITGSVRTQSGLDASPAIQYECKTDTPSHGTAGMSIRLVADQVVLSGTITLGNGGRGASVVANNCSYDIRAEAGNGGRSGMLLVESESVVGHLRLIGGHGGDGGAAFAFADKVVRGENGTAFVHPDGYDAIGSGENGASPGAWGKNITAISGHGAAGATVGGHGGRVLVWAGNGSAGAITYEPSRASQPGGNGGWAKAYSGNGGEGPTGGHGGDIIVHGGRGGKGGSVNVTSGPAGRGGDGGAGGDIQAISGYGGKGATEGGRGGNVTAFLGRGGDGGDSFGFNGTGGQGGTGGNATVTAGDGSLGAGQGGQGGEVTLGGGGGGHGGNGTCRAGFGGPGGNGVAHTGDGGPGFVGGNGGSGVAGGGPGGNDGVRGDCKADGLPSAVPTTRNAPALSMVHPIAGVAIGYVLRFNLWLWLTKKESASQRARL